MAAKGLSKALLRPFAADIGHSGLCQRTVLIWCIDVIVASINFLGDRAALTAVSLNLAPESEHENHLAPSG
jgi:hypothetical protein